MPNQHEQTAHSTIELRESIEFKQPTQTEIAVGLRNLADEIDAGEFTSITHHDTEESALVCVHKGMKVEISTGHRVVFLSLRLKDYLPVDSVSIRDLSEAAWKPSAKTLSIQARSLGPKVEVKC